ncbi:MAG TPA: hypothetical protein VM389_03625 [Phycisphaerae bacterium]|nr:hypothetical protein [Phycisphaerae bacterium]
MRNTASYHEAEREITRGLAAARQGIQHLLRAELDAIERKRRIAEYCRQVEAAGRIVCWLPRADVTAVKTPAYASRFDRSGDVLRPRA